MAEVHPIVEKALKCIDEIYPSENTLNETYLPTDAFIDEAVRWVIDVVPSHELTIREKFSVTVERVSNDGVGSGTIDAEVGRIVYFKANDWKRPVFGVITENDPLYKQQSNKVLRGNPSRPVVAMVFEDGGSGTGRKLEWYTVNNIGFQAIHVPYSVDSIPSRLYDITAWKLAEIVLMSMHDTQGASICTSKVNEHLEILAL